MLQAKETLFDRLDKFMEYSNLNDNKITVTAGLSIGILGKARKKSGGLSYDNIAKILCAYPNLSTDWLLLGKGEMLKTDDYLSILQDTDPAILDNGLLKHVELEYLHELSTNKSIRDFFKAMDKEKWLELINQHPNARRHPKWDKWDLLRQISWLLSGWGQFYFLENLQGEQKGQLEKLLEQLDADFLKNIQREKVFTLGVSRGFWTEAYSDGIFNTAKDLLQARWRTYKATQKKKC